MALRWPFDSPQIALPLPSDSLGPFLAAPGAPIRARQGRHRRGGGSAERLVAQAEAEAKDKAKAEAEAEAALGLRRAFGYGSRRERRVWPMVARLTRGKTRQVLSDQPRPTG